jgi:hypothetical protein
VEDFSICPGCGNPVGHWNKGRARAYTPAMDPVIVKALPEIIGPTVAVVVFGAIPVMLVYMSKHFKLRTKELELEAELHGRDSQARLQAMETRLSAMEGALGSLVQALSRRPELMQPPDAPQIAEPPDAPRPLSLTQLE